MFRLGHSLLGDDVEFLDNNGEEVAEELPLSEAFFNPPVVAENNIDPILKYLVTHAGFRNPLDPRAREPDDGPSASKDRVFSVSPRSLCPFRCLVPAADDDCERKTASPAKPSPARTVDTN